MGVGAETTGRHSYETKEEAERERKKAQRALDKLKRERAELTMEQALDRFRTYKEEERGDKPFSAARDAARAGAFFGGDPSDKVPHLGPESAKALYAALRTRPTRYGKERSAAEHRACLAAAKRFGAWLVRERVWTSNPIADVAPMGRPKAGEESKVQLRRDEARAWLAVALREAEQGDASALAAAVCLLLGLRVSEAIERELRDLEDDARYLLVPRGKTRAARRRLQVPAAVLPLLRAQVARAREAVQASEVTPLSPPLFPGLSGFSVRRATRRVCRMAKVPLVTTHALRATHASLAMAAGETGDVVAGQLGHSSQVITRQHYATAQAQHDGAQVRALRALED